MGVVERRGIIYTYYNRQVEFHKKIVLNLPFIYFFTPLSKEHFKTILAIKTFLIYLEKKVYKVFYNECQQL